MYNIIQQKFITLTIIYKVTLSHLRSKRVSVVYSVRKCDISQPLLSRCVTTGNFSVKCGIVQLNSNLTLARMHLAEARLIFKYTREMAASAQTSLW